jgi:hypothetical protein
MRRSNYHPYHNLRGNSVDKESADVGIPVGAEPDQQPAAVLEGVGADQVGVIGVGEGAEQGDGFLRR